MKYAASRTASTVQIARMTFDCRCMSAPVEALSASSWPGSAGRAGRRAVVDVGGADNAVAIELLDNVGGPPHDPGDHEDRSVERDRQAHQVVRGGDGEIQVRIEALLLQHDPLQRIGNVRPT